jgi:cobalamin biosynthesis protein CobT
MTDQDVTLRLLRGEIKLTPAEREEWARRAVKIFQGLEYSMTAYARVLTGNPRVRLTMSAGPTSFTDGQTIYYRPPLYLGDPSPHIRSQCERRDADGHLICPACLVRENVVQIITHEVAHCVGGSFAAATDNEKQVALRQASLAAVNPAAQRVLQAGIGKARWGDNIQEIASNISPFLLMIWLSLEDARIDLKMFKARPGTVKMFASVRKRVFENGYVDMSGQGMLWKNQPLNAQIMIGLLCLAEGYDFKRWLDPKIVQTLDDPILVDIASRVGRDGSNVVNIASLAVETLVRLWELGYCEPPEDMPQPPPPEETPEPEDQNDQDESNPEEGSEGGPGGSGESGEPSEDSSSEDSTGGPEQSPEQDSSGNESSGTGTPGTSDNSSADGDDRPENRGDAEQDPYSEPDGVPGSEGDGSVSEQSGEGSGAAGDEGESVSGENGSDHSRVDHEPGSGSSGDDGATSETNSESTGDNDGTADSPSEGQDGLDNGPDESSDNRDSGTPSDLAESDQEPSDGELGGDDGTSFGLDGPSEGPESSDREDGGSDSKPDSAPGNERVRGADQSIPSDGLSTDHPGESRSETDPGHEEDDDHEGSGDAGSSADSDPDHNGSSDGADSESGSEGASGDQEPESSSGGLPGDGAGDGASEAGDSDDPGTGEADNDLQSGDPLPDGSDEGDGDPAWDLPSSDARNQPQGASPGPESASASGEHPSGADWPEPLGVPDYGSAEDVVDLVQDFTGHNHDDDEELHLGHTSPVDEAAMAKAITQNKNFDMPTGSVSDVQVFTWPQDDGRAEGWARGYDHQDLTLRTGDIDHQGNDKWDLIRTDESILQPALFDMRRVFSDNRRGKMEVNLKTGRRINGRVLGRRAWSGDERLFQRPVRPKSKSYAVVIGLDISGSTCGGEIVVEKQAVFAQAELLHRMGIEFEVWAHTADDSPLSKVGARDYVMQMYRVKAFNEPWSEKTQEGVAWLRSHAYNLDGHTVEFYRKRLQQSSATTKILLYFTDGAMPASNKVDEVAVLRQEVKNFQRLGITMLGVGIGTDSPKQWGMDTIRINNKKDIGKVVKHLEGVLTGHGR